MANIGYVQGLINRLPADQRVVLLAIFDEVMRQNRIGDSDKATNFAWFAVESTTHATANTEFSVVHGMASTPSRFIPSIRLDVVGAQIVPLKVSRLADARRAYFTSSSTSAVFGGHFE